MIGVNTFYGWWLVSYFIHTDIHSYIRMGTTVRDLSLALPVINLVLDATQH